MKFTTPPAPRVVFDSPSLPKGTSGSSTNGNDLSSVNPVHLWTPQLRDISCPIPTQEPCSPHSESGHPTATPFPMRPLRPRSFLPCTQMRGMTADDRLLRHINDTDSRTLSLLLSSLSSLSNNHVLSDGHGPSHTGGISTHSSHHMFLFESLHSLSLSLSLSLSSNIVANPPLA